MAGTCRCAKGRRFLLKSALNILKLTDRYERKARLLPALLSCAVILPGLTALGSGYIGWVPSLSLGGALAVVGAVGLAYGASAAGRHFEKRLWPRWPHDAPTHRWLHPEDAHCSQQQRRRWFEAIGKVVHLDIAEAAASGDRCELELVINDAVRELRHRFRHTNEIGLLDTHNEDYGFARNLAGLRVFWLPVSAVSGGISWATYFVTGNGLALGVASSLVLVLALLLFFILPGYVRQRADRYAESFFGVLTSMAG